MRAVVLSLLLTPIMSQATWNNNHYLDIVNIINNNPRSTWKAKLSKDIPYENEAALKSMLGAIPGPDLPPPKKTPSGRTLQTDTNPPETYDLRSIYQVECPSISKIRHQGQCGSCWAVSVANAITDAYCIQHSKNNVVTQGTFSYQDLLENCPWKLCGTVPEKDKTNPTIILTNGGCGGGSIKNTLEYVKNFGVVTGEGPTETNLCKPYTVTNQKIPKGKYPITPLPNPTCWNSPAIDYVRDKMKIAGYTTLQGTQKLPLREVARHEIIKNGPIVVIFAVYEDFLTYKSGVYTKQDTIFDAKKQTNVPNKHMGWHAVRIIGWGVQSAGNPGTPVLFWLAANSWGTNWGENGFFKILRGNDHCRFESWLYSVQAI